MTARAQAWLYDRCRQLAPHAVIPLLSVWFLLVAGYTWTINGLSGDYISRDQWHFLPMVDHYLSGTLDWHELWQSHTEHVKPGYYLLFLWNARYLGLDMTVETMAGIVLLGIATWVLLRNMAGGRERGAAMPALALLAAGAVLMSFNQWANYSYGLLSLGGFGGMLAQFLVMLGFARLLRQGLDLRWAALLALALILAVLGFSGARGPALIGACLVAAVAAWWVMPEARGRTLRQAGLFLAAGGAAVGLYLVLLHHAAPLPGMRGGLKTVLTQPLGDLSYISGILTQSMLDLSLARASRPLHALGWVLPWCAYLLLGWCLWRYFRAGHWRVSWMPLLLIAYSALFTLEILVGRYGADHGLRGSAVPRYVFDAHQWLVGCIWILGLDWQRWRQETRRPLVRVLPAAILIGVLVLELINLHLTYQFYPFQVRNDARVALTLRAAAAGTGTADTLPRWECPGVALCEQGIAILDKYHLSFARDATDPVVLNALQETAQLNEMPGAKEPPVPRRRGSAMNPSGGAIRQGIVIPVYK